MPADTKEQFLETAETLFAERGFYGVSIAAIADELGLTKQALLHHFGSKEKIYGAVLQRISDDLQQQLEAHALSGAEPQGDLKRYLLFFMQETTKNPARAQLLMRELLDNKRRAADAATWYLKDYLTKLSRLVYEAPGWENATEAEAFAMIYQFLSAINYFAVSQPTLLGIFGKARYKKIDDAYTAEFSRLIDEALKPRC
ncbi:MAG: TetR/AcrR family transcriptional regulator [Pseudomonadota bacterium]